MFANSGRELIKVCKEEGISIAEYTIRNEVSNGLPREKVIKKMQKNLSVMMKSANYGMDNEVKSISGLIGGDAVKLKKYSEENKSITGELLVKAMGRALSCSEVNASMGKVVASPTAGSCGILPGVIISGGEKLNKDETQLVDALFTAAGVGNIIAQNATLSGAEGGCQAECGSAAAMGAAAVVEMAGGTPEMALDAASIVIKCVLGLVCDPIAGLVEVPCAKRNIMGTVNALAAADMVLAGIKSIIPFDDAVLAMYRIGKQMSCELRETAMGGLAVTPTGLELKDKILLKSKSN